VPYANSQTQQTLASRRENPDGDARPQVLSDEGRSSSLHREPRPVEANTTGAEAGKNGRARTVAELLARIVLGGKATSNIVQPARALIAASGAKNPSAVTAADIATVCAGWDHLRPSTRQGYHTGLKRNLELLNVAPSAWRGIPHIKAPDPRAVTAPDGEFEAVLRVAPLALQFVLITARETALRAGTIYKLTPRDYVAGQIKTVTKNSKVICVPVPPRLRIILDVAKQSARFDDDPVVHVLGAPRTAWVKSWMSRKLLQCQAIAGCKGKWVFHDLRRTAAHRLYEATGDLHRVKALLGHSSLTSTLIYLHASAVPVTRADVELVAPKGDTHAA
jgi:integrase